MNTYGYWAEEGRIDLTEAAISALLNQKLTAIQDKNYRLDEAFRKYNESFRKFVITNWLLPDPQFNENRVSPDGKWRSTVIDTGIVQFRPYTEVYYISRIKYYGQGAYSTQTVAVKDPVTFICPH